jgi:regulatory protein
LKGRGIQEEIIQIALDEIEDEDYESSLKDLLLKKSKELKDKNPFIRKKKLISFATGKGFEYPLVKECVDMMRG